MRSSRRPLRGQHGNGKLGLIIALLVVAGIIYFLKLAIPPRIQAAEFQEEAERMTRNYVVQQINYDQLVVALLEEAKKEGLPITEDSLRITESEARVKINVKYTVTQDLIGGKQWVRPFEIEVDVPKI